MSLARTCSNSLCHARATHGFGVMVWSRSGVRQFGGEMGALWYCERHAAEMEQDRERQKGVLEAFGYAATIEEDFAGASETVDWSSLKVYLPPLQLASAITGPMGRA